MNDRALTPHQRRSPALAAATILAAAILLSALIFSCRKTGVEPGARGPTVAERVKTAGKIRAAYALVEPAVKKDPNTAELSGIFVDSLREIARLLSLEVEFTEEVGWDSMIAGLNVDRYDIVCAQVWPDGKRAREAEFTRPLYYIGVGAYVRADDHRFDEDLSAINDPAIKMSLIDGSTADIIAKRDFPKATVVALPGSSDATQTYLEIVNKRADVTFTYTSNAEAFIRKNPGSLRNAVPNRPICVFGNTYLVKQDQFHFLTMLNTAIEQLHNSGSVEKTIRQYESSPGELIRVAPGYRVAEK